MCVTIGAPTSGCIQPNSLACAFDFAVRYTKGEEKVLDHNSWLAKTILGRIRNDIYKCIYMLFI